MITPTNISSSATVFLSYFLEFATDKAGNTMNKKMGK
jgi:hypothetical protein